MYQQDLKKGLGFAAAGAFVFSVMGVSAKFAVELAPVTMVTFFRQLFGLLAILPVVYYWVNKDGIEVVKTRRWKVHIVRTLYSLATMYLLTTAIWLIPLSDALLLSYTRPLFLPIIVWLWLRKRIEGLVWVGIIIAFVGIVFILKPEGNYHLDIGTIAGLLSGLTGAFAVLMVRRLGRTEPAHRSASYYFFIGSLIAFIPVLFTWKEVSWMGWLWLVAMGILAAFYQLLLSTAYKHARATMVSCVLYLVVVFTIVWDWLIWNQLPDIWSLAGMLLVCIGAIFAILGGKARYAPGEQPTQVSSKEMEEEEK